MYCALIEERDTSLQLTMECLPDDLSTMEYQARDRMKEQRVKMKFLRAALSARAGLLKFRKIEERPEKEDGTAALREALQHRMTQ